MVSLTGCGSSPKSAAEDFLNAIKKSDEKLLKKVYIGDSKNASVIEEALAIVSESEWLGKTEDFLDFKYKVIDVEENGDESFANVKITSEDWGKVISDLSILIPTKAVSMSLDGKSEKEIQKEIKKMIKEKRKDVEDLEFDVRLKLVKVDKEWKVDLSQEYESLLKAITGGVSY